MEEFDDGLPQRKFDNVNHIEVFLWLGDCKLT